MSRNDDNRRESPQPSAAATTGDDPQLARLAELTGLEGEALSELAGRLARLKDLKSGGRVPAQPWRSGRR